MVGVARLPPPPPPRPHHVNIRPRIHAIFPRPNKSGKVRDAESHARHARERLHIVRHLKLGSKSRRTEQSDSTDSRHGRPPCPPFDTSHFAGLGFRYGDCSLRTHNRHAVSVVTWKPHLAVIEMNDRWDGFIFFPSYCSPSLPLISFSLLLFCYIQTEASAYITGKDRKAQLWERGFPDRPAGYPWTPIHH